MDNIIKVTPTPRDTITATAVTQYDKGVTLVLEKVGGITYTASTEIQVTDGIIDAVRYPVTLNEDGSAQATIGDKLFRASGVLYVYVYNIFTDYEQTTATVRIPVKERPRYECNTSEADRDEENAILVSIREAAEEAENAATNATEAAEEARQLLEETVISTPTATVEQTDTGATVTITDKNGTTTATLTNGAKGETGATGPQGPQGIQGPQGEKGETGAIGPQGETGLQGPQGEKGPAGQDGVTPNITMTASVTSDGDTPSVTVTKSGTDTQPIFDLAFEGVGSGTSDINVIAPLTVGAAAKAKGNGLAIGRNSAARGVSGDIAIGWDATSGTSDTFSYAIAIGTSARANANRSIAIGNGATAKHDHSIALGEATTSSSYELALKQDDGTMRITGVSNPKYNTDAATKRYVDSKCATADVLQPIIGPLPVEFLSVEGSLVFEFFIPGRLTVTDGKVLTVDITLNGTSIKYNSNGNTYWTTVTPTAIEVMSTELTTAGVVVTAKAVDGVLDGDAGQGFIIGLNVSASCMPVVSTSLDDEDHEDNEFISNVEEESV